MSKPSPDEQTNSSTKLPQWRLGQNHFADLCRHNAEFFSREVESNPGTSQHKFKRRKHNLPELKIMDIAKETLRIVEKVKRDIMNNMSSELASEDRWIYQSFKFFYRVYNYYKVFIYPFRCFLCYEHIRHTHTIDVKCVSIGCVIVNGQPKYLKFGNEDS